MALCLFLLLIITTLYTSISVTESTNRSQLTEANMKKGVHNLPQVQHRKIAQHLSRVIRNVVFYKGNAHLKQVALTFDDGPDNYYTPKILDILRANGVTGTFFIVGKQAKRFPEMVKRIVGEKNAIGNHSWDHPEFWKLTNKQITQEIVSTQNEIQQITGHRTTLFRPPYGSVTSAEVDLIHNLGYSIIDWSVDTLDWKGNSDTAILQVVKKEVSPGGIILEHSLAGRPGELNGTLTALPKIINMLREQGYKFVTIPTLLDQKLRT